MDAVNAARGTLQQAQDAYNDIKAAVDEREAQAATLGDKQAAVEAAQQAVDAAQASYDDIVNNYIPTCEAQLKAAQEAQTAAEQAVAEATDTKTAADQGRKGRSRCAR